MKKIIFLFVAFSISINLYAQAFHDRCGVSHLIKNGINININRRLEEKQNKSSFRLSSNEENIIPVVFHIVLNQKQIDELGGRNSIEKLIEKQMLIINQDFTCTNADTSLLPKPFKDKCGKANVHFKLAATKFDGQLTNGFESKIIDKEGFNINGVQGSTVAFSDIKYSQSMGLSSWDNTSYLNIWVGHLLENNLPTLTKGITLSPGLKSQYPAIENEIGVVIDYTLWLGDMKGRALTHELGHFFSLKHIWGDDDGTCFADDGIEDTPIQADATFGCPLFPKYDNCTYDGDGVMFMNFMDYTDNNCQHFFTKGQIDNVEKDLSPRGYSYSLTLHPELTNTPSLKSKNNPYYLFPNPASDYLQIVFPNLSGELERIFLLDINAQELYQDIANTPKGSFRIDLKGFSSGVYCLKLVYKNRIENELITIIK